jgi:hypothetical protein
MFADDVVLEEVSSDSNESFGLLIYKDDIWDLSHLDSLAFQCELKPGLFVTVVVTFSCHCFTRSFARDQRLPEDIPPQEIFDDGRERRVLCRERYEISRSLLRPLILTLHKRRIVLAGEGRQNFLTLETTNAAGEPRHYAVFFEVSRDKLRKRRLMMRVQSAYVLDRGLSRRQREARRVLLRNILLAALEGRKVRP